MDLGSPTKIQVSIILYNCQEDVVRYEDIYEKELQAINFSEIIQAKFKEYVQMNGRHFYIIGPGYRAYCGTNTEPTTSKEINIYGEERGLFEFIALAKTNDWKVLDCGLSDLLDLSFPQQYSFLEYRALKLKERNAIEESIKRL